MKMYCAKECKFCSISRSAVFVMCARLYVHEYACLIRNRSNTRDSVSSENQAQPSFFLNRLQDVWIIKHCFECLI